MSRTTLFQQSNVPASLAGTTHKTRHDRRTRTGKSGARSAGIIDARRAGLLYKEKAGPSLAHDVAPVDRDAGMLLVQVVALAPHLVDDAARLRQRAAEIAVLVQVTPPTQELSVHGVGSHAAHEREGEYKRAVESAWRDVL